MDENHCISVVVPVWNEAANLPSLYEAVSRQMEAAGYPYELVLVDDGSRDPSLAILRDLARRDERVRVVSLSRNFGTQVAITAGLEFARGTAVIVMDADLQHPPELIPQMIAAWREGAQVVYTLREYDEQTGWFKRFTSKAFCRAINLISDTPISPGESDFRLMDRVAVEALLSMPERSRFLRAMINWLGFRQVGLRYKANPRLHGKSKYSVLRLVSLALQAITSFSVMPLRVSAVVGLVAALSGLPYALWAVYVKCFTTGTVPGWPSLIVAVLVLGGVQLMSIGIIGEYIGRIYTEVKGRPLYLAKELVGFDHGRWAPRRRSDATSFVPPPHFVTAPVTEETPQR